MMERDRERESVIDLNLKVQETINIVEYEMTTIIDTKNIIK